MKFCKDCEHLNGIDCDALAHQGSPNLVTGEIMLVGSVFANEIRWNSGDCGPDAKLFKPRPAPVVRWWQFWKWVSAALAMQCNQELRPSFSHSMTSVQAPSCMSKGGRNSRPTTPRPPITPPAARPVPPPNQVRREGCSMIDRLYWWPR